MWQHPAYQEFGGNYTVLLMKTWFVAAKVKIVPKTTFIAQILEFSFRNRRRRIRQQRFRSQIVVAGFDNSVFVPKSSLPDSTTAFSFPNRRCRIRQRRFRFQILVAGSD